MIVVNSLVLIGEKIFLRYVRLNFSKVKNNNLKINKKVCPFLFILRSYHLLDISRDHFWCLQVGTAYLKIKSGKFTNTKILFQIMIISTTPCLTWHRKLHVVKHAQRGKNLTICTKAKRYEKIKCYIKLKLFYSKRIPD